MHLPHREDAEPLLLLLLLLWEAMLSSTLLRDSASRRGISHIPDSVPCVKGPWQPPSHGVRCRVLADPTELQDEWWLQEAACSSCVCVTQRHRITTPEVKQGCTKHLCCSPLCLHHHLGGPPRPGERCSERCRKKSVLQTCSARLAVAQLQALRWLL